MAECNQLDFELPGLNGRKIEGNFRGGNVSSDGEKQLVGGAPGSIVETRQMSG